MQRRKFCKLFAISAAVNGLPLLGQTTPLAGNATSPDQSSATWVGAPNRRAASNLPREITGIYVDVSRLCHDSRSNGDTWDYIWAADGSIYSFNCDGRGYGTVSRNVSFNRLTGNQWNQLVGSTVNEMDYGKDTQHYANGSNWKVTGADSIDGVLYAFMANNWYGNQNAYGGTYPDPYIRQTVENMSLIKSVDDGKTWTRSESENYEHPMWTSRKFSTAYFFKYGQDGGHTHQDEQNRYVYAVSNDGFWNNGAHFYLGRVLRSKIRNLNVADWEYFSHGSWTANVEDATPIPGLPSGYPKCTTGSPLWLAALRKYVTVTWYDPGTTLEWHYPENVTFAFYQADHPWGPWSYIGEKSADDFIGDRHKRIHRWYGPSLSPKFVQENKDGSVTVVLTFSGQTWEDKPTSLYKNNSCPITFYTTPQLRAAVNHNDTDAVYSAGWSRQKNRGVGDYDDDVHITTTPGSYAEFKFAGRGIEVLSEKTHGMGKIEIMIDGRSYGIISLDQDPMPLLYQVEIFRDMNLSPGSHILRIINRSADDSPVVVDGFRVYTGHDFNPKQAYRVVNRVTRKRLAIRDGALISADGSTNPTNSAWLIKHAPAGGYRIMNSSIGENLSVLGISNPAAEQATAVWTISAVGNGTFSIIDRNTGYALSVDPTVADGRPDVVEQPYFSRDLQKWEIVPQNG